MTSPKTMLEMESGPHWFWFTGWQGIGCGGPRKVALADVEEPLAMGREKGAMFFFLPFKQEKGAATTTCGIDGEERKIIQMSA